MVEKLIADEDTNATSSQQDYFVLDTKKIIVKGDVISGHGALSNMQQDFFKIDGKEVALPGDSDGSNTITTAGSNDYFYLAKDSQPTHYTPESTDEDPTPTPGYDSIITHPTLSDDIIAYWKFDENTGTTITDATGNGYDFDTMSGTFSSEFDWVTNSKINSGLKRKSTGYMLRYIYSSTLNNNTFPRDNFSLNIWIKGNITTISNRIFISLWTSLYTVYFGIRPPTSASNYRGKLYFAGLRDSSNLATSVISNDINNITDGNWHMITFTRVKSNTSTDSKLYFDGVEVSGYDTQTNYNYDLRNLSGKLTLGGGNQGSQILFSNGEYDEYGIWSRALTASEVEDLYNSGNGLKYD
jgi:hypothetical protein